MSRSFLLCLALLTPARVATAGSHAADPPGGIAAMSLLDGCLDSAAESHPALLAARARHQAALERIPQVTALPDPTLNLSQALRRVETRVGSQTGGVTLSQSFPWFGTRDLRGRVARSEAEAESRVHQEQERELAAQARRAFYDLAYFDAALRVLGEERSLLGHYESLAQARYATGHGLLQAVIRLQAELTRVTDRERTLTRQRRTRGSGFNTLCGRTPGAAIPEIPPLVRPEMDLTRERLLDLGERYRQELLAASHRVRAGEEAVELAGMADRPSITASLGVMNVAGRDPSNAPGPLPPDEGKNSVSLSVGMTLPFWNDRYTAAVEEAGHRLSAARHRLEQSRDAMAEAIEQALIRIETLDEQIELLDVVLIPQSEEALRATEIAYEADQVGVLDLLDSERVQLDIRRMRARYLSDFMIATADLERAIGVRPPLRTGGAS